MHQYSFNFKGVAFLAALIPESVVALSKSMHLVSSELCHRSITDKGDEEDRISSTISIAQLAVIGILFGSSCFAGYDACISCRKSICRPDWIRPPSNIKIYSKESSTERSSLIQGRLCAAPIQTYAAFLKVSKW